MNKHIIFTAASWEPRFFSGFERILTRFTPERVVMYFFSEYANLSQANRERIRSCCKTNSITLEEFEVSFADPIGTWKVLYATAAAWCNGDSSAVIDITTMPRETTWILFGLFGDRAIPVTWAYHKPQGYNNTWLSRDPDRPRLVPKMGGVTKLGFPIKLLLTSGFDVERARQLILFFEPEHVLVGIQTGIQFGNKLLNAARHLQEFQGSSATKLFEIDAYAPDCGYESLEREIKEHLADSNLIMASLGPKTSAVALYRIHNKYPQTSLAYAPSKEFNPDYSFGIAETLYGQL
ncbi:MAG TPA: hypothetical protein VG938_03915 [Verrucomicrobiae bacterium]|jgi:hypothetical protein|nr:hypothetical protein [Verrucomicrobiae bacterium]